MVIGQRRGYSGLSFAITFPAFGFLHESSDYQTKQSLVYDLQEPFRWLGDVTVVEAFEPATLDVKDFYFMGDDYRYHIETEAKMNFLDLLKYRFNAGVRYKGKTWKWDTVIQTKAQELARFLSGKSATLSFFEPVANLIVREGSKLHRERPLLTTRGTMIATLHNL